MNYIFDPSTLPCMSPAQLSVLVRGFLFGLEFKELPELEAQR